MLRSYESLTYTEDQFKDLLQHLKWTSASLNIFWRALYCHGMWIPVEAAQIAVEAGLKMLDPRLHP